MPRLFVLSAVLALGLAPVPFRKADPMKGELLRLQGEWVQTKRWTGGREANQSGVTCVFDGDRRTVYVDGVARTRWRVKLDLSKTPKVMDLLGEPGGEVLRGVYRFDGDTFLFSYPLGSEPASLDPSNRAFRTEWRRKKN